MVAQTFLACLHGAATGLEPDPGSREGALFGVPGGRVLSALAGLTRRRRESPRQTPEDVAVALHDLPVVKETEERLWTALELCVSSARYWQPPDGFDALAATSEVSEPLAEVGRRMIESGLCQWWDTPLQAADQWTVTWAAWGQESLPDDPVPDPRSALIDWHRETVAHEQALRGHSRHLADTAGGDWWVLSRDPRLPITTRSDPRRGPVGLWLVEDSSGGRHARAARVVVPDTARVYEVDGAAAWARLCDLYPCDVTWSRRHVWGQATGWYGGWVIPDFLAMAQDFDAVHVSVAGYLATAGRVVPVGTGAASTLAGWNPDETVWLRDVHVGDTQAWSYADPVGWVESST